MTTSTVPMGPLMRAITPQPCCVVSGGGSPICRAHVLEGWTYVLGASIPNEGFGSRGVDKMQVRTCGCVYGVLSSLAIALCATHRHGTLACCGWASALVCGCYEAFACLVHGEHHHGTHD